MEEIYSSPYFATTMYVPIKEYFTNYEFLLLIQAGKMLTLMYWVKRNYFSSEKMQMCLAPLHFCLISSMHPSPSPENSQKNEEPHVGRKYKFLVMP
jgi:hypothetical protein